LYGTLRLSFSGFGDVGYSSPSLNGLSFLTSEFFNMNFFMSAGAVSSPQLLLSAGMLKRYAASPAFRH